MNLREWNEALFKGVVKDVGAPGDPLYFYVDDDVLANISGISDPDAALQDFIRAFEAITFEQSAREATKWRSGGYKGTPVFLAAMAITVLAVTLEPIGRNSNNVYRRQNELLRRSKIKWGKPEGYEEMSVVWGVWNDYLESPEGRKYGVPTAKRTGKYSHQGFARSQAFIRFEDKQDINMFLEENTSEIPSNITGPQLVRRLGRWLSAQGSRSRLVKMCGQKDVQEELGAVLLAARAFWGEEQQVRSSGAHFEALPRWDLYEEAFDLVVPLKGIKGIQGATVIDFDLEEYQMEAGDDYAYLSTPYTDPLSWLSEPMVNLDLNEDWTASWSPPEDGVYLFVEDVDDDSWVGASEVDGKFPIRALVTGPGFEKLKDRVARSGVRDGLDLGVQPSGVEGFDWLTVRGEARIEPSDATTLGGTKPTERSRRNHFLSGGLRLRGNTFLNGFEPNIVITNEAFKAALEANLIPEVLVDGKDIWQFDLLKSDPGGVSISLSEQFLIPGEHAITVRVAGKENNSRITSQPPSTPALFPPIQRRHRHEHIVRFTLERNEDPKVLVIQESGKVLSLEMSPTIRYWLRILEKDKTAAPRFERYFDSSWFDWLRPAPGTRGEDVVVAARSGNNKPWKILLRKVHIGLLKTSSRVRKLSAADPLELADLFGPSAIHEYVDAGARRALAGRRREATRILGGLSARWSDGSEKKAGAHRPMVKKRRPDTGEHLPSNPYEHLLWWLTERGEEGALTSTVENSFKWLCERLDLPEPEDFKKVVYKLEALGYVERFRGRIRVQPASANWLPDSEALVAISGARSESLVGVLESGEAEGDPTHEDALGEIDIHVFTQTETSSHEGSKRPPAAPQTVYLQLGSRSLSASEHAHALGFQFYDPSFAELRHFPALAEKLVDEASVLTLSGIDRIDLFTPRQKAPGGRWRKLSGGLASLDADSFLRTYTSAGKRYVWWSREAGLLSDVGWVYGLWGFHQGTQTEQLFAVDPLKDRFAVRDYMLFPPDLERFLVMRSGLLPRTAERKQDRNRRQGAAPQWRVYTNISTSIAALVSEKMGHAWLKSKRSSPTELGDLVFL